MSKGLNVILKGTIVQKFLGIVLVTIISSTLFISLQQNLFSVKGESDVVWPGIDFNGDNSIDAEDAILYMQNHFVSYDEQSEVYFWSFGDSHDKAMANSFINSVKEVELIRNNYHDITVPEAIQHLIGLQIQEFDGTIRTLNTAIDFCKFVAKDYFLNEEVLYEAFDGIFQALVDNGDFTWLEASQVKSELVDFFGEMGSNWFNGLNGGQLDWDSIKNEVVDSSLAGSNYPTLRGVEEKFKIIFTFYELANTAIEHFLIFSEIDSSPTIIDVVKHWETGVETYRGIIDFAGTVVKEISDTYVKATIAKGCVALTIATASFTGPFSLAIGAGSYIVLNWAYDEVMEHMLDWTTEEVILALDLALYKKLADANIPYSPWRVNVQLILDLNGDDFIPWEPDGAGETVHLNIKNIGSKTINLRVEPTSIPNGWEVFDGEWEVIPDNYDEHQNLAPGETAYDIAFQVKSGTTVPGENPGEIEFTLTHDLVTSFWDVFDLGNKPLGSCSKSFFNDVETYITITHPAAIRRGDTAQCSVNILNKKSTAVNFVLGVSLRDPLNEVGIYDSQIDIFPAENVVISPGQSQSFNVEWLVPMAAPFGYYEMAINCWSDPYTSKYIDNIEWAETFFVYGINILSPTSVNPAEVDNPGNPDPILVYIEGIPNFEETPQFSVMFNTGSVSYSLIDNIPVQFGRTLLVNCPSLNPGFYDLTITYQPSFDSVTVSDVEYDAIKYSSTLNLEITTDKETYSPAEQVTLEAHLTDINQNDIDGASLSYIVKDSSGIISKSGSLPLIANGLYRNSFAAPEIPSTYLIEVIAELSGYSIEVSVISIGVIRIAQGHNIKLLTLQANNIYPTLGNLVTVRGEIVNSGLYTETITANIAINGPEYAYQDSVYIGMLQSGYSTSEQPIYSWTVPGYALAGYYSITVTVQGLVGDEDPSDNTKTVVLYVGSGIPSTHDAYAYVIRELSWDPNLDLRPYGAIDLGGWGTGTLYSPTYGTYEIQLWRVEGSFGNVNMQTPYNQARFWGVVKKNGVPVIDCNTGRVMSYLTYTPDNNLIFNIYGGYWATEDIGAIWVKMGFPTSSASLSPRQQSILVSQTATYSVNLPSGSYYPRVYYTIGSPQPVVTNQMIDWVQKPYSTSSSFNIIASPPQSGSVAFAIDTYVYDIPSGTNYILFGTLDTYDFYDAGVTSVSTTPTEPQSGDLVDVKTLITNHGSLPLTDITLSTVIVGPNNYLSVYNAVVNPGEKIFSWDTSSLPSGTYSITSTIVNGLDSDETNNQITTQITLFPPPLPPDTSPPNTIISPISPVQPSNTLAITWTGEDDQTNTLDLEYSYRLLSYDDTWSTWTTAISQQFENLPDGIYTLEVKARDQTGNEDPTPATQTFRIDTTLPTITSYSPVNTDVHSNCVISMTFSELMNQSSVQNSFSITPFVTGHFSWMQSSCLFTPSENLLPYTTYTIVVTSEACDIAGNPISENFEWHFTTVPLTEGLVTFYTDPIGSDFDITFRGSTYSNGETDSFTYDTTQASANSPLGFEFDHWEVSGGVSVGSVFDPSTTVTVVGDGELKAVYRSIVTPGAFAHVVIEHTYRGDLIVDIGVGDPSSPVWSQRIWNGEGGGLDGLDLTVDLSGALAYLPPDGNVWFLKVYDRYADDQGQITEFSIFFDGSSYVSGGVPVAINDLQTCYVYIPSGTEVIFNIFDESDFDPPGLVEASRLIGIPIKIYTLTDVLVAAGTSDSNGQASFVLAPDTYKVYYGGVEIPGQGLFGESSVTVTVSEDSLNLDLYCFWVMYHISGSGSPFDLNYVDLDTTLAGYQDILPVSPGETINAEFSWWELETINTPVWYVSVFGDWDPTNSLGNLASGVASPSSHNLHTVPLTFNAPSTPGVYEVRLLGILDFEWPNSFHTGFHYQPSLGRDMGNSVISQSLSGSYGTGTIIVDMP